MTGTGGPTHHSGIMIEMPIVGPNLTARWYLSPVALPAIRCVTSRVSVARNWPPKCSVIAWQLSSSDGGSYTVSRRLQGCPRTPVVQITHPDMNMRGSAEYARGSQSRLSLAQASAHCG